MPTDNVLEEGDQCDCEEAATEISSWQRCMKIGDLDMAPSSQAPRTVYVISKIKNMYSELTKACPAIQFREIEPSEPREKVLSQLQAAEFLVGDPDDVNKYLSDLPNLKWLQVTFAGVEKVMQVIDPKNPPPFPITRVGGMFGEDMADYVIGNIIAWEKKFKLMMENQKQHIWYEPQYRRLSSLSLGILGLGDIGKDVARLAKAHSMTVWGMGRSPRDKLPVNTDQYRTFTGLQELLSSCDYVCNIFPSTPSTKHMLSGDVLKCCAENKPVFINMGRHNIIDEASLVRALREGWISGAILDVFDEEPLPKESVLWDTPGVFITPHMATLLFPEQIAEVFAKNVKLYEAGQPLRFLADVTKGY